MSDGNTGIVCRGSFALGTACGKCERCKYAIERYEAGQRFDAALNTPSAALRKIRDLEAQLAAKDALIRELTEALRNIADGNPTCDSPEATASYDHVIAKAAITRAKEMGYE